MYSKTNWILVSLVLNGFYIAVILPYNSIELTSEVEQSSDASAICRSL